MIFHCYVSSPEGTINFCTINFCNIPSSYISSLSIIIHNLWNLCSFEARIHDDSLLNCAIHTASFQDLLRSEERVKLTLAMRQCPPDASAFVGKILGTKIGPSHIFLGHSHYHLVMTNSSPWKPWPIEIDDLPINSMVILTMAMLVITRWYLLVYTIYL